MKQKIKTAIVCDPSSTSLGLCMVKSKSIIESWTIKTDNPCFAIRCGEVARQIYRLKLPEIDEIYFETILGNTLNYRTHWSTGAILTGLSRFCRRNTKIFDKTAKSKKTKKCVTTSSTWQSVYKVEKYHATDKDKDDKILRAYYKHFDRQVQSADEAVAIMIAQILINEDII